MQLKQDIHYQQQQQQTQKLAMTQQLQQSIQILNYSAEELLSFVENKALENPFMEVDTSYREQYFVRNLSRDNQRDVQQYINQLPDEYSSLYDSLIDQIHLNYRKSPIRSRMIQLVELIDSNGYLTVPLSLLAQEDGTELEWLDALTLLQQLEPAGIGARNLQECLLLQIERDQQSPELAYLMIEESFDDFAKRHWKVIAKRYQISLAEVQRISDYILTLTPHPGAIFQSTKEIMIIPDLKVTEEDGKLHVISNKGGMPKINFVSHYYDEVQKSDSAEGRAFAQNKRNEFSWIQRSLHQRHDTILSVGQFIVAHQKDFFLKENHPLKPLSLKEVADALSIHESTVSRAVNGKYIETWFGIYELRSLFAKGTSSKGENVATKEIHDALRRIINDENKEKPLSDQKLVDLLAEKGYKISRRTVAKYRDQLNIPSASKRKRF